MRTQLISGLVFATIAALAPPEAIAKQDIHFRSPEPVSSVPFVGLVPGKTPTVSVQACVTKKLLDQLVLWPGAPIMVEYRWQPTGQSWPSQTGSLPLKSQLVIWLENNTEFCTAGHSVKREDFPHTGMWDVTVSMHAQLKQYNDPNPPPSGASVLLGGELARIRVDAPGYQALPLGNQTAGPVPVPPPAAGQSGGEQGSGQSSTVTPLTPKQDWSQAAPAAPSVAKAPQLAAPTPQASARDVTADALSRKLEQLTGRIKTLERGGARCNECGDLTRRVETMRRRIVTGLAPAQAQQLTLEADRLGGEIARLEAARGLPAVQGPGAPEPPVRTQPSAPTR